MAQRISTDNIPPGRNVGKRLSWPDLAGSPLVALVTELALVSFGLFIGLYYFNTGGGSLWAKVWHCLLFLGGWATLRLSISAPMRGHGSFRRADRGRPDGD